jgi:6-phosphogluconolactonase
MASAVSPTLRVFPDPAALAEGLAAAVVGLARAAADRCGRFALAVPGGQSPRPLYAVLARRRADLPWPSTHIFWVDERYVPPDHPLSNYRLVWEMLLNPVGVPPSNIHPMPTGLPGPEAAAAAYEAELKGWFGTLFPRFDLVLLGLGADGHIASLLPGSAALTEERRAVRAVASPRSGPTRLTLTFPALNSAAHVYVLASGRQKAAALQRALAPTGNVFECPARGLRPADGELVWWADEAAASLLGVTPDG